MPNTLPTHRIPAQSPRVRALCRWHQDMNMRVLGMLTATHPQFPLIQGAAPRRPRAVKGGGHVA